MHSTGSSAANARIAVNELLLLSNHATGADHLLNGCEALLLISSYRCRSALAMICCRVSKSISLRSSAYLCGLCVENVLKRRERRDTQRTAERSFEAKPS